MTLRGNVQDFPLRSVLDLLSQTKKTGELQVRAGDSVGALGIAGGRVVTAVFGEEEPLLALRAIFAIDGAEFEFTLWDDAPPANLDAGTLDDLLQKAEEAKRQADEARRKAEEEREAARKKAEEEAEAERQRIAELRTLIPTDDVPFRLSERAVDQGPVTLTPEEWRLVLAVNGERDLHAIAAMLHLDNIAALTALAELVRDGIIEAAPRQTPPAYEAPVPTAPAYEAPTYDMSTPSTHAYAPEPAVEAEPPAFEAETPTYEAPANAWAPASTPEPATDFASEPAAEVTPASQDWITPDQAAPAEDWAATPPTEPKAPISEVIPGWATKREAPAPEPEWIKPQEVEPAPAMDDRLSALSGIFGPAPSEPEAPPAESPTSSWAPPAVGSDHWGTPPEPTPSAERWTKPPAAEPAPGETSDDPWGTSPSSAPTQRAWSPPPSAPASEKDDWTAHGAPPAPSTWSAPAAAPTSADPWGTPGRADSRAASFRVPEPSTPPVEEWSAPPAAPPEKKKRGLFGFGREKPAPPPVAGMPLPTAGVVGSRVGMIAALANALIAEYNTGQYGKSRVEERIANLLMRVDEQADPIDRPLPIVDDRIDVEALEREQLAESQALPYLGLLVTTIFADAEKAFGKDKAKKGYKAAQKSVLLGDASVLSSPELAGKLPRV
jgi:hypothetical protein